jgi:ABC-2 type transport system permease protein
MIGFLVGTISQLPIVNTILRELSLDNHFIDLTSGLIKATDVLFYVLVTAVALFAATRVLESKRWR